MIGRNGGRRSGISAQAARHDDDDDDIYKKRFSSNEPSSTRIFVTYIYIYIYIYISTGLVGRKLPLARKTRVQSLVKSCQRFKRWYSIPPA